MIALYVAASLAFVAIAVFVWTVVRSAVRQVVHNSRAGGGVEAYWTAVHPDEPIPAVLVDLDELPVDEPLVGESARAVRDALLSAPVDLGRGYNELNTATGGRSWEELKRKAY